MTVLYHLNWIRTVLCWTPISFGHQPNLINCQHQVSASSSTQFLTRSSGAEVSKSMLFRAGCGTPLHMIPENAAGSTAMADLVNKYYQFFATWPGSDIWYQLAEMIQLILTWTQTKVIHHQTKFLLRPILMQGSANWQKSTSPDTWGNCTGFAHRLREAQCEINNN